MFNVGDKVIVKQGFELTTNTLHYVGKEAKVTEFVKNIWWSNGEKGAYRLDIDNGRYNWKPSWLELVNRMQVTENEIESLLKSD